MKKITSLYKKNKEVINYLIFGVLTTVINLLAYYGLTLTILDPRNGLHLQIANVTSWIVAVIFAYITNRKYVFESKNKDILKEGISFFGARVITLVMDMIIMFIGVSFLKGNDKIIKILSQIIVIISNYVFSKIYVFRKDNKNELQK